MIICTRTVLIKKKFQPPFTIQQKYLTLNRFMFLKRGLNEKLFS